LLSDFDFDLDFDFDADRCFALGFCLPFPLAAVVVVALVVVVVVHGPPVGASKSPCRICAGTARLETTIRTNGCFFECVRWQRTTFSGFSPVVVVPVVLVPVVVVPVVVVPVVVVPVVVVVDTVVVDVDPVVVCCAPAAENGPLLLATAIDVAKPATRSASMAALIFMTAESSREGSVSGSPI
jgi:hypothetical protein